MPLLLTVVLADDLPLTIDWGGAQGNRMKLCWADSGPERTK
jgi:hypothetical protein